MKWFDTENRFIKIIKLLEQTSELNTNIIAKKLDVSTKTIQNDIKDLNSSFKGSAFIDLNHSAARLYVTNFPEYQKCRNTIESRNSNFDSPQMRMAFIVDMLMNTDSPYLIDELAYAMNISRSTLIKDMNKLKKILVNYNLTIQGQANIGINLIGKELDLRFFILDNNYNILCNDTPLSADIVEFLKKELVSLKLDRLVIENFFRYLTVSLNRSSQNHSLIHLDSKYQELSHHYYYKFLNKIFIQLENTFAITFSNNEQLFMTIPLISMRTPYDISSLESNIKVSDEILKITQEIISTIREKMDINLDEKNSDILDEFVYHNYFLANRLRYGLPIHNQTNNEIKEKYTVAYHMALIAQDVIEQNTHLKIPEDEVGYLTAYFQIFLTEKSCNKTTYKVALICSTGRVHGKLIFNQLKKIFEPDTIINIFIYNEQLQENQLQSYDLIISTVKNIASTHPRIIYIHEAIDEDYLRNKIERIRYTQHLKIPLLQGVKSLVLNLLSQDNVLILDNTLAYMDNVYLMINKLIQQGVLDESFWERILQRESKSSMVLDSQVAFPHARHSNSDKVIISLGLIPGKLNDNLYPELKVIFLVAIPTNSPDDTILVKIYDEIISMASQPAIIEDIAKLSDYNELLMYFIKRNDLFP